MMQTQTKVQKHNLASPVSVHTSVGSGSSSLHIKSAA